MSAGHHHNHVHRADLMQEVDSLLRDPQVAAYLQRGYRVNASFPVPLTGGSSVDGLTYYIHPDVPLSYRQFVLWHERVEKALRAVKGMSYSRAHDLATTAERMLVEAKGVDWSRYKAQIAFIVKYNEHRPARMPPDFDTGPYQESGTMHLLEGA